jgi:hypothetical protein
MGYHFGSGAVALEPLSKPQPRQATGQFSNPCWDRRGGTGIVHFAIPIARPARYCPERGRAHDSGIRDTSIPAPPSASECARFERIASLPGDATLT